MGNLNLIMQSLANIRFTAQPSALAWEIVRSIRDEEKTWRDWENLLATENILSPKNIEYVDAFKLICHRSQNEWSYLWQEPIEKAQHDIENWNLDEVLKFSLFMLLSHKQRL